jgi:hypothetical protein
MRESTHWMWDSGKTPGEIADRIVVERKVLSAPFLKYGRYTFA